MRLHPTSKIGLISTRGCNFIPHPVSNIFITPHLASILILILHPAKPLLNLDAIAVKPYRLYIDVSVREWDRKIWYQRSWWGLQLTWGKSWVSWSKKQEARSKKLNQWEIRLARRWTHYWRLYFPSRFAVGGFLTKLDRTSDESTKLTPAWRDGATLSLHVQRRKKAKPMFRILVLRHWERESLIFSVIFRQWLLDPDKVVWYIPNFRVT